MHRHTIVKWAVASTLALGAMAGCAGEEAADVPAPTLTSSTVEAVEPEGGEGGSVVAEAAVPVVEVFAGAEADAAERSLAVADEVGGRLIFLVADDPGGERIRVHLPVRPNGSTGWVRRGDVNLSRHDHAVAVELGAHRLVVRRGGDVVFEGPIGVGTGDTPTPGGVFYIKELLQPPDPTGPYGTYAYGLSGFSNELESFAGGAGVIGIHGTNDPASIGTDVSYGCIRLHNDDIERLVEEIGLPLGTPVEIIA